MDIPDPILPSGTIVTAMSFESPVEDDYRSGPYQGPLRFAWAPGIPAYVYTVDGNIVDPATVKRVSG